MKTIQVLIFTTCLALTFASTMNAQTPDGLAKIWELQKVEQLTAGMGSIEGLEKLDFSDSLLVLSDGKQSVAVLYNVVDKDLNFFDKDGNPTWTELIMRIEYLTRRELYLLLIAREEKVELVRLHYTTRD